MLHSMAAALAGMNDVSEIGTAITEELRTILAYHNCRVYVMQDDGSTLLPVAFRGEIFYEYEHETMEELIVEIFAIGDITLTCPFPRMTWEEAMDSTGTDRPDTRFGLRFIEATDIFKDTSYGLSLIHI